MKASRVRGKPGIWMLDGIGGLLTSTDGRDVQSARSKVAI
jgi:hypothetical protein